METAPATSPPPPLPHLPSSRRTRLERRACLQSALARLFTPFSCLICIRLDLLLLIWAPPTDLHTHPPPTTRQPHPRPLLFIFFFLKADVCKQCRFSSRAGLDRDRLEVVNPGGGLDPANKETSRRVVGGGWEYPAQLAARLDRRWRVWRFLPITSVTDGLTTKTQKTLMLL